MRSALQHAPSRLGDLMGGAAEIPPTARAAYSDRTALVMCDLAELAYFPFEAAGGARELGLRLTPGGFSVAGTFSAGCTQAFLALSPKLAVLAFRGTVDRAGWRADLDARLVQLPGAPEGLLVHEGFHRAFDQVRAAISAAVGRLGEDVPLYVTGHSLGGALAQLAAAALDSDRLAACYTFGSPRVATLAFDALVHAPHYRVVHDRDLVPGVPPAAPGFRHTGDPRLLLLRRSPPGRREAPDEREWEVFRRDRGLVGRVLVDVLASSSALVTGQLPEVEDHMIWEYRTALACIAAARTSHQSAA